MLHSKLIFKSCLLELYGILSHLLKVTHPLPSYFSLHVNVFENWYSLDAVLCSDPRYNFSIMSFPKSSRFLKVVFCMTSAFLTWMSESLNMGVSCPLEHKPRCGHRNTVSKRGVLWLAVNMNSPQKVSCEVNVPEVKVKL